MAKIRILLVDDSERCLTAIAKFLVRIPNIQLVGTAKDGPEALIQAASLQPDLVIMDMAMPGMDGLTATRRLKATPNAPRVVIATVLDTSAYQNSANEAGVDGYIDKADLYEKLPSLLQELFPSPLG